ncbi:hypothetical protein [Prochlorothrix hollandica]|uniref:Uncharacterized protein n=1 Tax=Prochlorothrix hollandica PCC 9006 = CALU 1027 TaxID=317619 RepID=A0A0M2PW46_PROHO|nr:hypothetical protein [Prochlorothrix hollandica]KKI99307.1 hypothetical protein PROH_16475 [Prochlorothrix hollandica PCC 9006 = CALU 1027]
MSIHKLSLTGLQKVRSHLQDSLVIPHLENNPSTVSLLDMDDEVPEPTSLDSLGDLFRAASDPEDVISAPNLDGRWFLSSANAGIALRKLPGLQLQANLRLVTYLLRTPTEGQGVTWAIPEATSGTAQLEEALETSDRNTPPRPRQSLDNLMLALTGDSSPTSYLLASLFSREVQEFGMVGSQHPWVNHRLVGSPPAQVQWEWKVKPPQDFTPKVRVFEDGRKAVEFFSCHITAPITLYRHLDQYPAQGYAPHCSDRPIAVATRKIGSAV